MSSSGGSSSGANEHTSVGKGASDAAAASSGGGLHGVMELGGASFQVTFLPASSGAPHDLLQAAVRRPGEAGGLTVLQWLHDQRQSDTGSARAYTYPCTYPGKGASLIRIHVGGLTSDTHIIPHPL